MTHSITCDFDSAVEWLFAKWANFVYEKLGYLPSYLTEELASGEIEHLHKGGTGLGSFTVTQAELVLFLISKDRPRCLWFRRTV